MYATDLGNNNVISLSIAASTSALTPVAGSPFTAGTGPNAVAVDPSGTLVYVSNKGSNDVSAFNSKAGVLTQVKTGPTQPGLWNCSGNSGFLSFDANGTFLFVCNTATNGVASFGINPDGTLLAVPDSPFGLGIHLCGL